MLRDWYRYAAHCHVQGASQSGKSKFCEGCIRDHIMARDGVCLIDWHGTLFGAIKNFLAYRLPKRPIVLLDFSRPEYITPFNPFALPAGREPSSHVNRLASVLVKPWGAQNTNELPTYERMVKMLLAFMAATGEPLHHAARLFDYPKKELREWAISQIESEYWANQWKVLQYTHSLKEWESKVLSTQNRLGRFLSSRSIVRFTGLPNPTISIAELIRQKAVILINLRPSQFLDKESGRVFAALILSEFLDAAIENMDDPQPYYLYLDECQNYLSNDAAQMLDQVLKSGLRMTLIHHHVGQFHGDIPLQQSIETNARLKVVFAGLPLSAVKATAEEFFLEESNERWCKETRYRYVTDHVEEPYETTTSTDGESHSEGGVGENDSWSHGSSSTSSMMSGTRFVPVQRKERDGQEDYSREEKIAQLAGRIMSLRQGECYISTPHQSYRYSVPRIRAYLLNPVRVLEYEKSLLTNAIPIHEADKILGEAEARFLRRGEEYDSKGKSRPKKRPLSPQH